MKTRQKTNDYLHLLLLSCLLSVIPFTDNPLSAQKQIASPSPADHDFYPGDYSQKGVIGQSLPGTWRAFSADSLWNREIPKNAPTHPDSDLIMSTIIAETNHLRLPDIYTIPVWVVNSNKMPLKKVRSDRIFDTWDTDTDGWSDSGVPITEEMWAEPTGDGHICIIDPFKKIAWEMSRFRFLEDGTPHCTTFNIWDLTGPGAATPFEGKRWSARGGRGSGFPVIAGLIRPEELRSGEIRHALEISFTKNRKGEGGKTIVIPPAARSDGKYIGKQYPIQGMLFQLDPTLGEKEFNAWGLNREGKIVARALQQYGMYLGDNGGPMTLKVQLLAPSRIENRIKWEALFPGFYNTITKIPADRFRVVYTGEALTKR